MSTRLPPIEQLPHRSATDDMFRSGELAREIRSAGGVAITLHGEVEMVMIDAQTYRELAELAEGEAVRREPIAQVSAEREAVLAELSAAFDRRLARLREPGVHEKIDAVMACRGKSPTRPKAGTSF
jgi:hypothetical protein